MIVYQYFSAKCGIQCIESRKLRISTIDTLNDPFEIRPKLILSQEITQQVANELYLKWRKRQNETAGMLCYSNTHTNPLLWSHYADRHRGIAIGFFFSDDNDKLLKVNYPENNERPELDFSNEDHLSRKKAEEIYTTKAKEWAYEKEYRELEDLHNSDTQNGMYFTRALTWTHGAIRQRLIQSVICGAFCATPVSYLRHALSRNEMEHVGVSSAVLSPDKYEVIVE